MPEGSSEALRIPVLKMGDFLLVSIQVELLDDVALALEEDLAREIERTGARGVLIDVTSIRLVDSFIGRVLVDIAAVARLLDCETVLCGIQPAVAMTLVALGLSLAGVRTALSLEQGLAMLDRPLNSNGHGHDPAR